MSVNEDINSNQFITLDYFKTRLGITDDQDDDDIEGFIQTAKNIVTEKVVSVVDSVNAIVGTRFYPECQNVAYTYTLFQYRRDINQMYNEADKLEKTYEKQLEALMGDMRSIAPVRTSRQVIVRDVPIEDDYFAERHIP
jgi:hypothetical protein